MNNDVYPQQDQIKPTEVGNKFCPDTKELDFFQKNGIVKKTGGNNVIGEFKNDSIYVKILLKNCVIKYRAIESMLNCSKSLAKYHNGNLVFYDSTDRDCNIIIHFDIGLENHNSTKVLPKYLQGNSRDKIE